MAPFRKQFRLEQNRPIKGLDTTSRTTVRRKNEANAEDEDCIDRPLDSGIIMKHAPHPQTDARCDIRPPGAYTNH
jgi:hypothetical protein